MFNQNGNLSLISSTFTGNQALAGSGGNGGSGGTGGARGNAQGGAFYNLVGTVTINSSSFTANTVGMANPLISAGGAGGPGGNAGLAEGVAGGNQGGDTTLTTAAFTSSRVQSGNGGTGGNGGLGGNGGTPTGVAKTNGGAGGSGGSVLGGNIFNASNADFINDTIVFGQAVAFGLGGPGGSGAGKGGLQGADGKDGTSLDRSGWFPDR